MPIDRFYIEDFLRFNRETIRGIVFEVGDNQYTKKFGTDLVRQSLIIGPSDSKVSNSSIRNINLESGEGVSEGICDCLILTQVLPFIFDVREAVKNSYRLLRSGGVILATMGGISQISRYDMDRWGDYWRFTDASARKIFGEVFGEVNVSVRTYGNVATAKAFLDGRCGEEFSTEILFHHDLDYQVSICVYAIKK